MRLNEFRFERDIESKIDEFGILSDKIDKVKKELSELSNRYKEIEGELRPTLEQLHIQNKKSIQTKRYLVTLKRIGYNRENFKYKESFEKSLTKVNQQTKKVLEDILLSTKTVSRVVSSIGVQRMDEISLTSMLKKLVSPFKKLFSRLRMNIKRIDGLNRVLKSMVG
jgi:plasmid rolling circle replication initiator protein Rep